MSENSQMLLRHILEAPYPDKTVQAEFSPQLTAATSESADKQNFDKLKAAYDACLDEDTIKKYGVTPLLEILNETSSRLSAQSCPNSKAISEQNALADTVLYLANLGVSAFAAPFTGADDRDPDTVIISVSAPYRIGLPAKELYKDEKIVSKYETVASEVITALYEHSDHKVDSHALVEFEKKLAAASPDAEDRDDVTVCQWHTLG